MLLYLNWVLRQHGPFLTAPVVAWVLEWDNVLFTFSTFLPEAQR